MKSLFSPNGQDLIDAQLDITQPRVGVSVNLRKDNKVLWVDVDGVNVLRICGIKSLDLIGLRKENPVDQAIFELSAFLDAEKEVQDAVLEGNPELKQRLKTLFRVTEE